jgi:RNA polymerase sigma factor (sigma-70 family)
MQRIQGARAATSKETDMVLAAPEVFAMAHSEEYECIRAVYERNPEAMTRLYKYLKSHVIPRLRASLPRYIERDDLVSDTLLILWQALTRLRNPAKLLPYALRVTREQVVKKNRENRRWASLDPELEVCCPAYAEQNPEREEFLAALQETFNRPDRTLFTLLYIIGYPPGEVQAILGISAHVLALRKSRLHKKLRSVVLRLRK